MPIINSGQQCPANGPTKYIWYPDTGEKHYFDLVNDPNEMTKFSLRIAWPRSDRTLVVNSDQSTPKPAGKFYQRISVASFGPSNLS